MIYQIYWHLNKECKKSAGKFDVRRCIKRSKCIVCGSPKRNHFLTVYGQYNYYECSDCEALTLENYPNIEVMYTSDETENLGIYTDEKTYENRVYMIAKPKAEYVFDVIKNNNYTPSSTV